MGRSTPDGTPPPTDAPGLDPAVEVGAARLPLEPAAGPDGDPDPASEELPLVEPPAEGMGWLAPDAAARQALRPAPDDDGGTAPALDTRAFRRPPARDPDLDRPVIAPRVAEVQVSGLEPAAQVQARTLSPPERQAWREASPPPAVAERPPPELARVGLSSFAAPGQVCPTCGGPLRIVRNAREERLDATWFRLEWLQIDRGWGDCPHHARVETVPLRLPAFLDPDRLGNGLLAWLVTWRWRDHMPGHEITRLLRRVGLPCTDSQVARWLARAGGPLARVAAEIRARVDAPPDERGIDLVDAGVAGRLRAAEGPQGVAFRWTAEAPAPTPPAEAERARRVLLDLRGWSRAGRQAALRRRAAFAVAADPGRGGRLAWRMEELLRAADRADEDEALAAIDRILATPAPEGRDPALAAFALELAVDRDGLRRFGPQGPLPPLPLPEHVRNHLPPWVPAAGDGGGAAIADALTVVESLARAGRPTWPALRDLLTAAAEQGPAFDPAAWVPATRAG